MNMSENNGLGASVTSGLLSGLQPGTGGGGNPASQALFQAGVESLMSWASGHKWTNPMMAVARALCRALTLGLEVFCHGNFGLRYMHEFVLLMNAAAIGFAYYLADSRGEDMVPFNVFVIAFGVFVTIQLTWTQWANWKSFTMHTRYCGVPWLFFFKDFRISEFVFKTFIEPGIGLLAAWTISQLSDCTILPLFIGVASLATCLKNRIDWGMLREKSMDQYDAHLDSLAMHGLLKGQIQPCDAMGSSIAGLVGVVGSEEGRSQVCRLFGIKHMFEVRKPPAETSAKPRPDSVG